MPNRQNSSRPTPDHTIASRPILTHTIGLALAAATLMSAPSALAGDITRDMAASDFKWTPTECLRPTRPFIAQRSPQAQAQMQGYARKVAVYLDCLKMEAQRDFDRAQVEMQEAVQRTLQAETDELNDAVEAMARQSG